MTYVKVRTINGSETLGEIMTDHSLLMTEAIELIGGEILDEEVQDCGNVKIGDKYYYYEDIFTESETPVQELARVTGKCEYTIYKMAKKLGRLPTVEEVKAVKNGRPRKYK